MTLSDLELTFFAIKYGFVYAMDSEAHYVDMIDLCYKRENVVKLSSRASAAQCTVLSVYSWKNSSYAT